MNREPPHCPHRQLEDTKPLCRSLWKTGRREFWAPDSDPGCWGGGGCPILDTHQLNAPSGKGKSEFVNP